MIQDTLLNNRGGAISALNRILRTSPNDVATLRRLADLYAGDGQWNEAVALLQRVVNLAPERDVLRDTHFAIGNLWDEHLGETSRALVSFQAVLALDPTHGGGLAKLADLQEREGKLPQALETTARLLETRLDPAARALALTRRARIERRQNREEAAILSLREALGKAV
jgi:tetratricopeptide (TPR) repeat protein